VPECFSQLADLRRQLAAVVPGTAIAIAYKGARDGRKMFEVTTA
jgi:hypothetical protein